MRSPMANPPRFLGLVSSGVDWSISVQATPFSCSASHRPMIDSFIFCGVLGVFSGSDGVPRAFSRREAPAVEVYIPYTAPNQPSIVIHASALRNPPMTPPLSPIPNAFMMR